MIPFISPHVLSSQILQISMKETVKEATPSTEGVTEVSSTQDSSDQPQTRHMHGWALASLTLAFMSICLVLAIDNTILCLYNLHRPTKRASDLIVISKQRRSPTSPATSTVSTISVGMVLPISSRRWHYCLHVAAFMRSIISNGCIASHLSSSKSARSSRPSPQIPWHSL